MTATNSKRRRAGTLACGVLAMALGAAMPAMAQRYDFTTTAGGWVGDGLPATSAAITTPTGIAFDSHGNGYVAQYGESRIRKISPDGSMVTTLVGDGIPGFSGDGGPASAARIDQPFGLVIDAADNLYFADAGNGRVRKVTPAGVITTVAGNGSNQHSGDGGAATSAGMMQPYGLALDGAGNLYISDWQAHRIRKVTPAGIISTIAGNGTAGFSGDGGSALQASLNLPEGMSLDQAGNLYVADALNHRIRMITPSGIISTVAGNGTTTSSGDGGPATQAGIYYPFNVIVDPEGGLVIGDTNCFIRRVVAGTISTVAGNGSCDGQGATGPALGAGIGAPEGMAFDAEGDFFFADPDHGVIRRIYTDVFTIETVAGIGNYRGDGVPALEAVIGPMSGVTVDPAGNVLFTEGYPNRRVRMVTPAGIIHTIAGNGDWWDGASHVSALATGMDLPMGVVKDAAGNVYFADRAANVVRKITPAGTSVTLAGSGNASYSGDGGDPLLAGMDPWDLALDAAGNLYIADRQNNRVRRLTPAGELSTMAGTGVAGFAGDGGLATAAMFNGPSALAIDALGQLYVHDQLNSRVRRISAGKISTVAGNGAYVPGGGNGGPATQAQLGNVRGLAVDRNGILYLAEGNVFRRVTPDGRINAVPWAGYMYDVAADAAGSVHIATAGGHLVRMDPLTPIASDFDLDLSGTSDLFWRNASTGESVIWRSANSRLPIRVTRVTSLAWQVEALGDFDGDGKTDVFWRNRSTGANVIWSGSNSSRSRSVPTVSTVWELVAAADFDGDDVEDVMWRNTRTGANLVWRSADSTTPMSVMGVTNLSWQVVGTGDFDGDGRADLLWRDSSKGKNVIWRGADGMDPQSVVGVTDLAWQVVGVGDFNGDGRADILWRQKDRGINVIWRSGNAGTQQDVTDVTNPAWLVAGVGDYNGDGRSDILWRHGTAGSNVIWRSALSSQQQAVSGVTNTDWMVID